MTGSNAQKALTIERKVCPRESGRKANKNTLDVVGTISMSSRRGNENGNLF